MDEQTLAVALISVLGTQTFMGLLVALQRKDSAVTAWALGFGGSTLGFSLLLLSGLVGWPILVWLGDVLVGSFVVLFPLGFAFFLGIFRPWRRYSAYLVIWTLLLASFTFLWPSYPLRSGMTSAFFVLMTAEMLVLVLRHGRGIPPPLRLVFLGAGVVFGLFHGVRGVWALSSPFPTLMSDAPLAGVTFLVTTVFSVLWGGLLLVVDAWRLQEQVSSHNDNLSRLNRLKDRLLAMTSHDLRGPLGNLQVLWGELTSRIGQGDCAELDKELLQMVDRSLAGTQSLLENLFSFAEHQGTTDPKAQSDLSAAISVVLDQWMPTAMTKKVALRREGEGSAIARVGFEALLTVLRNVVGNAVKFTPSGGSVTRISPPVGMAMSGLTFVPPAP